MLRSWCGPSFLQKQNCNDPAGIFARSCEDQYFYDSMSQNVPKFTLLVSYLLSYSTNLITPHGSGSTTLVVVFVPNLISLGGLFFIPVLIREVAFKVMSSFSVITVGFLGGGADGSGFGSGLGSGLGSGSS